MSQSTIPRTPTPETLHSDQGSPSSSPTRSKSLLPGMQTYSAAAMTPPPSTQLGSYNSRPCPTTYSRREALFSPPPTLRTGPPITSGTLFGELPTTDMVEHMDEVQLRRLVSELIPALGDARTSEAHSRLQYGLLAMESEESIKRAEVEHNATRREVRYLQEANPGPHDFSPIVSPQASAHRNVKLALSQCRDLQIENDGLEKRLRAAKKVIERLHSQNADYEDQIQLLRRRIKENREHMNDLRESGAMSIDATPQQDHSTPHMRGTPRTPATGRSARDLHSYTTASQTPFEALIQAATLNHGETNSVPASPNLLKQKRLHQHMRGAYSLSSLPSTPERRPVTADAISTPIEHTSHHRVNFSAPGTQSTFESATRPQDDRESTISASDNEDDVQEESLPGSQASQMASSMLRRTLEAQNDRSSPSKKTPNTGTKMQSKLFGHVVKPGAASAENTSKRSMPHDGYEMASVNAKKAKNRHLGSERIGLGIQSWPSPNR